MNATHPCKLPILLSDYLRQLLGVCLHRV
jgi:hypothetical protein